MMEEAPIEGLKALAHPLRYAIITTLHDRELNVGEIEAAAAITQPALSQQLAILRNADLVSTRREAKQVYYMLNREQLAILADALSALIPAEETATQTSAKRLTGAAMFARLNI